MHTSTLFMTVNAFEEPIAQHAYKPVELHANYHGQCQSASSACTHETTASLIENEFRCCQISVIWAQGRTFRCHLKFGRCSSWTWKFLCHCYGPSTRYPDCITLSYDWSPTQVAHLPLFEVWWILLSPFFLFMFNVTFAFLAELLIASPEMS